MNNDSPLFLTFSSLFINRFWGEIPIPLLLDLHA